MNYKETGFRALYHQFCTIPLNEKLRKIMQEFPDASKANAVLTYGYYDREAGFTLEILAAAIMEGQSARFSDPSAHTRASIRIGAVKEVEFMIIDDADGSLHRRYADQIDLLHIFDADEDVEETRKMIFLDACRHDEYIDDISVYLIRDGLEPELCWVRITGLAEHCIIGNLLNEPHQDFGCHQNEEISFGVQQLDDDKIICISNLNQELSLTSDALKDGRILERAVHRFNKNRNEDTLTTVLEILRNSEVLVPCDKTKQLTDHEIPNILHSGERYYLMIFSNREAMGEYSEEYSILTSTIMDIIPLARNSRQKLNGIVLNPFTEPFILDEEIWDILDEMEMN